MKKNIIAVSILSFMGVNSAFAAALDRSGQPILPFLQDGNYFEVSAFALDPHVSGTAKPGNPSLSILNGANVHDMGESYSFVNAALKVQATEHFSIGLLYDQPFGAKANYSSDESVIPKAVPIVGNQGMFHNGNTGESTNAEVKSENISLIIGFQPNKNWNLYAGPAYQSVKGNVQLRGMTYGGVQGLGGYTADIPEDSSVGWLAGVAYQIPEIALKAAVTYRSSIDHKFDIQEDLGALEVLKLNPALGYVDAKTKVTTPESVNLDFQTGLNEKTLLSANLRWVNWKDFVIRPHDFGFASEILAQQLSPSYKDGFNLADWSKDQWSVNLGLGRKLNEQWAVSGQLGWDSGAGNPVTTLGPVDGYWSVGAGVQYNPTSSYFVAAGVKYFWLGDAAAQAGSYSVPGNSLNAQSSEFKDNYAIAYGLKFGYKF